MSTLALKRRRDIARQKWQFLAVLVTVVLGVMMFAASFDAFLNLEASYTETYDRLGFADMTVTGAEEGFADTVAAIDGVAVVETRRQADVPFRIDDGTDSGHVLLGRVVGMPPDEQPAINRIGLLEGTYLQSGRPEGVVVERHLSDHFDLQLGDAVAIVVGEELVEAEIIGIAVSAEYIVPARSRQEIFADASSFGVLFVDEAVLAAVPATIAADQTLLLYDDEADTATVDAAVTEAAEAAGATDIQTQADQPSNNALQLDLEGFAELAIAFPVMFLLAAGMATFILLTRIVYSQRPQIGTMMANGVGRRSLLRHYIGYGLVLGTVGAVIGIVLGILGGFAITGAYTSILDIPDTVREIHPITPIVGLVFGVVTGALAAWAPARAAFRTSPAEAMRGDTPPGKGTRSIFETLLPPLRGAPTRWKMVLRGIGRNKRRSVSTVIGVVLALTLILASWGMVDTVVILLDRQFNEIALEDASILYNRPLEEADVARAGEVAGVAAAEPVVTLAVTIRGNNGSYATQLQAFQPDTVMHGWTNPSGALPDSGVLLGVAAGELVDAAEGDVVELAFPTLDTRVRLPVADFVDEPVGTLAYMELGALAEALATGRPAVAPQVLLQPGTASVYTSFTPDADRDATLERLADLSNAASVVDSRTLFDLLNEFLAFFYGFVGVMLLFGGIMAFALIFNTMSVNLQERVAEIANLRANGLSRRRVANLVTGENLLLTALGIPPGLLVGYLVAASFMASFSSDLFDFGLELRWSTVVLSAAVMLVVALISLWPGLRAVGRIDIGKIVRERSR